MSPPSIRELKRLQADLCAYQHVVEQPGACEPATREAAKQVIEAKGEVDLLEVNPVSLPTGERVPRASLLRLSILERLAASGLPEAEQQSVRNALTDPGVLPRALATFQAAAEKRQEEVGNLFVDVVCRARQTDCSPAELTEGLERVVRQHNLAPEEVVAALVHWRINLLEGFAAEAAEKLILAAQRYFSEADGCLRDATLSRLLSDKAWVACLNVWPHSQPFMGLLAELKQAFATGVITGAQLSEQARRVNLLALSSNKAPGPASLVESLFSPDAIDPTERQDAIREGILARLDTMHLVATEESVHDQQVFLRHLIDHAGLIAPDRLAKSLAAYAAEHIFAGTLGAVVREQAEEILCCASRVVVRPRDQEAFDVTLRRYLTSAHDGWRRPESAVEAVELLSMLRRSLPPFVYAEPITTEIELQARVAGHELFTRFMQQAYDGRSEKFRSLVKVFAAEVLPHSMLLGAVKTLVVLDRHKITEGLSECIDELTRVLSEDRRAELARFVVRGPEADRAGVRFLNVDLCEALRDPKHLVASDEQIQHTIEQLLSKVGLVVRDERDLEIALLEVLTSAASATPPSDPDTELTRRIVLDAVESAVGFRLFARD